MQLIRDRLRTCSFIPKAVSVFYHKFGEGEGEGGEGEERRLSRSRRKGRRRKGREEVRGRDTRETEGEEERRGEDGWRVERHGGRKNGNACMQSPCAHRHAYRPAYVESAHPHAHKRARYLNPLKKCR